MSLTIQDCASQTAAERRERRRNRIVQNAEQRLSAILAGPDGNEKRQAPSIEGIFGNEQPEEVNNNHNTKMDGNMATKETSFIQEEIQFVAPLYHELVDRHRFWLMLGLGVAFRVAVHFGLINYVLPTFTAIFFSWELLLGVPQKHLSRKYPKHGYTVNMLLISGLNERMVAWFGLVLDLLWEFGMDLCLVTFSFTSAHMLLQLANAINWSPPCCASTSPLD